jgi:hypothetical protein
VESAIAKMINNQHQRENFKWKFSLYTNCKLKQHCALNIETDIFSKPIPKVTIAVWFREYPVHVTL